MGVQIAEHEPAAVKEHQYREGMLALRGVDPNPDIFIRQGEHAVLNVSNGFGFAQ
ncbi:hypothetical protein [Nocardia paucivorans]|uniref:hypothetical protein n=1 Tax=Nocardia paucivorans TaxID=114259 RepID=UPI001FDFED43|nr:hypothetical protein [Nocardia paucivorans]